MFCTNLKVRKVSKLLLIEELENRKSFAHIHHLGVDNVAVRGGGEGLIAVKDNIATKHFPTTCGSGILQRYHSPFEATVLGRIHGIGSAVVGKTNLDEFGMGSHSTNSFFGPVNNRGPLGGRSAGGSSGGSAVTVATGQCKTALGTDTGGSVRLPAAYTGICLASNHPMEAFLAGRSPIRKFSRYRGYLHTLCQPNFLCSCRGMAHR